MGKVQTIKHNINNKEYSFNILFSGKTCLFTTEIHEDLRNYSNKIPSHLEYETLEEIIEDINLINEAINQTLNENVIEENVILYNFVIQNVPHYELAKNSFKFISAKKQYKEGKNNKFLNNNETYIINGKEVEVNHSNLLELEDNNENKESINTFLNKTKIIFEELDNMLKDIDKGIIYNLDYNNIKKINH